MAKSRNLRFGKQILVKKKECFHLAGLRFAFLQTLVRLPAARVAELTGAALIPSPSDLAYRRFGTSKNRLTNSLLLAKSSLIDLLVFVFQSCFRNFKDHPSLIS